MPILQWSGKDKVMNHHWEVPYRVLEHCYGFSKLHGTTKEETSSGNKIIHGDNLEALKSLQLEYEGKIKCIYLDPPYNTGNEHWIYHDNVNDPKLNKWLGKIVGKESEDLTRHDKWLCMMYPRLKLLHKLLAEDGIIFISIDDHEMANLRVMMDEIFGYQNFIEYFSWVKTSTPPSLSSKSRKTVEYVLCYEKKRTNRKYKAEEGDGGDAPLLNAGNTPAELRFPKGSVRFKIDDGFYPKGEYDRVLLCNDIEIRDGYALQDFVLKGEFKWTQATLDKEIFRGSNFIIKSEKFSIRYLKAEETFKAPTNFIKEKYTSPLVDKKTTNVETNEGAKKELLDLFGKNVFDYPKPVSLIEYFLKFIDDPEAIVLDSFAGSGTTAHAVLKLNQQDNGKRKFILIQRDENNKEGEAYNIAENITAQRIKKVINEYTNPQNAFDYYELGEPLFLGEYLEELNEQVDPEKIKAYVWYTETRTAYSKKSDYFLGKKDGTAYYFFYKATVPVPLDRINLPFIKEKAEQYIVYADRCLLPKEFLTKHNIIFKKIPGDIERF
ncbi:MAG TPA: site-specific DNA-methyltransferase [Cytophagaceae bacterium]|nr:site-specific DNA-methyltransferase [Cytophagaceae bacterium]